MRARLFAAIWTALFAAIVSAALRAGEAWARVGGGGHFSGGGGHYSGGGGFSGGGHYYGGGYSGGGDGGFVVYELIRLIVLAHLHYPLPMIGLDLIIFYIWKNTHVREVDTQMMTPDMDFTDSPRPALEKLEGEDPRFSEALFKDFCYTLYSEVHHARGKNLLDSYGIYLGGQPLARLKGLTSGIREVSAVIVGGFEIHSVQWALQEGMVLAKVRYEVNYTEKVASGASQSWYARELWTFERKIGVQSLPPEKLQAIACPACGAPPAPSLGNAGAGRCPSCGNFLADGSFNWFVTQIDQSRTTTSPTLTNETPAMGPTLPTIVDPEFQSRVQRYQARDPGFSLDTLQSRAKEIFIELQKAWTDRKWDRARPFETDRMFHSHYYWIAEYQKQHLINALKGIQFQSLIPVKFHEDPYFVSCTVRIFASMIDYTETESGKVVSGDPRRARSFSEYWTFIRSVKYQRPKISDLEHCPSCGAALKISMAGTCDYCKAKITSGEFDWVLSLIEQDEAYRG